MKNMRWFLFVLTAFLCAYERAEGADILYVSTTASPSHHIWDKTLAMTLRDKGHHITFVTHSPEKSKNNFTVIVFEDVFEKIIDEYKLEESVIAEASTTSQINILFDYIYLVCKLNHKTEGMKQILNLAKNGKKFDLIILDVTCGICFYPMAELFGYPPLIGTSPFGIHSYMALQFGIDMHSSYVPHYAVTYSGHMSFTQRLHNYFAVIYELSLKYYYWGLFKNFFDDYYGRDMSHIYDIEKNVSLLLANYDPILDYPRPLPPNVIPVGGLHAKRAKPLPQDLQKYLDNSKDGVILFSLGTNVRSDRLRDEQKKVILAALAQLKQNVIWKFESNISDLPKNVIVRTFLPQNDILAHPSVKLLINHGGSLSTQEAMYHGVPLLTIPFFLDQHTNTFKVLSRKIGLTLNINNITVDYMVSTIREVLNNPIYKQNIRKISQVYRDKPDNPLDRAVFWVEHVLRQGGTECIQLPAKHMPFYQTNLLDIWLFVISIVLLVIYIIKTIINRLLNLGSKDTNKKKLN